MEKMGDILITALHTHKHHTPLQKNTRHINILYKSLHTTLQILYILHRLDKVLLTMCRGPVGQYANYIDEGTERANDSQSVKCFYCLLARADPVTPFDDPQAKGHLSWGQGDLPRADQRDVAMVTALAEEWQGVAFRRRGVTVDVLSCDVVLLDLVKLHSEAAGEHSPRWGSVTVPV